MNHDGRGYMRPKLIHVNPEHLINLSRIINSDVRCEDTKGENLCCKRLRSIDYLIIPNLGVCRLNLNYCFVCGRPLHREGNGSPGQAGG